MTGIQLIKHKHKAYPALLREIYNRPAELHVRGALPEGPMIAIVGSRKPTSYGREVAFRLAFELARAGYVVVSGLALGIDGIVHRAAVEAGGQTIAVLGSGVDQIYPKSHQSLGEQILDGHGALISEYPAGTSPQKHHFPARNRIIAGLALGVVVPEADARSGSLITARLGLEEGRTVMAVPGSILSQRSEGANNLLKAGAVPVTRVVDICLALGFEPAPFKTDVQDIPEGIAGQILTALEVEPQTVDQLIARAKLPLPKVLAALNTMELTGHIRNLGGGYWIRLQ